MQKLMVAAATAVTLSLALAPAGADGPALPNAPALAGEAARAALAPKPERARIATVDLPESAASAQAARGQSRSDYEAWLAASPANREAVNAFVAHLEAEGVSDVIPVWQLIRTSSSWRQCAADRFEVAPRDKWANIVATLRFVEEDVVPVIGPVQAVSGYRNARLNACSDGAPASAHRHFFALDLVPASDEVDRGQLIRDVCRAHARKGEEFRTGLGFYSGVRFHVDSNGFRRWGPDGRGASSPCVTYS